ncbi:MAG: hypothetical protein K2M78_00200 [Lachnospiraceae bacterium]|nr:hypothetical protein [Lachnospiraceae bacterium]
MNILNKFLQAEINSKEFCDCIMNFINSYEIRRGEFEGNEFIILKIDRDNFILYPEYDDGKEGLQIPFSISIYRNVLIDEINRYVKTKGIV